MQDDSFNYAILLDFSLYKGCDQNLCKNKHAVKIFKFLFFSRHVHSVFQGTLEQKKYGMDFSVFPMKKHRQQSIKLTHEGLTQNSN